MLGASAPTIWIFAMRLAGSKASSFARRILPPVPSISQASSSRSRADSGYAAKGGVGQLNAVGALGAPLGAGDEPAGKDRFEVVDSIASMVVLTSRLRFKGSS
jgi:hypothetical protein